MQDANDRRHSDVEIAVLQTKADMQAGQIAEILRRLDVMAVKFDLMSTAMSEARGGARTLIWFGGAAATLGAGLAWAVEHVLLRQP